MSQSFCPLKEFGKSHMKAKEISKKSVFGGHSSIEARGSALVSVKWNGCDEQDDLGCHDEP
jgi:hypothetical protein